jgi:hypothetical protein
MIRDIKKKSENKNRQLYDVLTEQMNQTHGKLATLYCGEPTGANEYEANIVHQIRSDLWFLKNVLKELLLDEYEPGEILKCLKRKEVTS